MVGGMLVCNSKASNGLKINYAWNCFSYPLQPPLPENIFAKDFYKQNMSVFTRSEGPSCFFKPRQKVKPKIITLT
jgi:hypothetical protein